MAKEKEGETWMGKAGKKKEMVEDWCVQEMHVEVRCVKGFRVKVGYVKMVCDRVVCESAVGERMVWDRSGCKSIVSTSIGWESVCPRTVCEGVVRESSVCKGVVCQFSQVAVLLAV